MHLVMGNVKFDLLVNLLMGSISAIIAGVMLSARFPRLFLRLTSADVLSLIGIKLAHVHAA